MMRRKKIMDYLIRQAALIVFMFDIGFDKEEVMTAVNALRIKKDLQMIVELLGPKEELKK